ncbi:MAG: orotate phosphoribosyltransferase [Methylovulum sp.]|jgi:orotate phosphoribosyltransferase
MHDYQRQFIDYAIASGVLKFGDFLLKSGRKSPYFFNTGLFNTGAQLGKLGQFYAQALQHSTLQPDIFYGPAYKGIPLVCATAIAYAELTGQEMPYAFNRKEAKDHGEGGLIVGAPLQGKVLIIDDVMSAGLSVRESITIIHDAGAHPMGVLIALDRQEKGLQALSAVQEVSQQFGIPVIAIISLHDIIAYLTEQADVHLSAITEYQGVYGV